jgi:3'-phosphoadenosine 5'-phosphosulfate sulfotransferase
MNKVVSLAGERVGTERDLALTMRLSASYVLMYILGKLHKTSKSDVVNMYQDTEEAR